MVRVFLGPFLLLLAAPSWAAPILSLSKSSNPAAFAIPGSLVTYRLIWANNDPSPPPPAPLVDIVWVVDSSGSMSPYQGAVAAQASPFVDSLGGLNYRLAVVNFTAASSGVRSRPVNLNGSLGTPSVGTGAWTTSKSTFASMVQVGSSGSGFERGLQGLRETVDHYTFRAGAVTIFVLVTDDADNDFLSDLGLTIATMNSAGIQVFGIACGSISGTCCPKTAPDYCGTGSITDATGGRCESICDPDGGAVLGRLADAILSLTGSGALSEDLPAGTNLVSAAPWGVLSGSNLDWHLGPLAAGSSGTAQVVISLSAGLGSVVTNCAVLSESSVSPVTACASLAVVTPTPRPLISLSKSASSTYRLAGETLVYVLSYDNSGDGAATQALLQDNLQGAVGFLGAQPPPTATTAGGWDWDLGLLPPGAPGSILISLTVNTGSEGTTIVNSASLGFDNAFAPGSPATVGAGPVKVYVVALDLFEVDRNAINPSQGQKATLRLGASQGGAVNLRIYNSAGELVRTLLRYQAPLSLAWVLEWDGRDDAGEPVASGVYLVRFSGPRLTQTRRLVVIR